MTPPMASPGAREWPVTVPLVISRNCACPAANCVSGGNLTARPRDEVASRISSMRGLVLVSWGLGPAAAAVVAAAKPGWFPGPGVVGDVDPGPAATYRAASPVGGAAPGGRAGRPAMACGRSGDHEPYRPGDGDGAVARKGERSPTAAAWAGAPRMTTPRRTVATTEESRIRVPRRGLTATPR